MKPLDQDKDADQRQLEVLKKRLAKWRVVGLDAVDDVSELFPVLQKNDQQNTKALDIAVKEILAEDFSLVGIDDPSEALHVLESKLAGMSTLDRATTFTRLGEKLKETHFQAHDAIKSEHRCQCGTVGDVVSM